MTEFWFILPIVFILSALLTGILRRYALSASLLDVPNARSSHQTPTPRGGGGAIVLVFLSNLPLLSTMELLPVNTMWALLGAGFWVAAVGFLDDHKHIPAGFRLIAHFIGAIWGLFWLGGMPPLPIFGFVFDSAWVWSIFAMFYLVWMLNLYNFMDGIDGLAGIEAITVCLGGILLYCLVNNQQLWALAILAAATGGFLLWNFPPAKIFMGDAGSGFLGVVLGLFSIQAAWYAPVFFWSWLILLGVFVVDASLTLIRRFLRGDKVHQAHRSHAYQNAARYYGVHRPVSLAVGAINLCWLTPLAILVGLGRLEGIAGLAIAYSPLMLLAVKFKAGIKETL